MQEILLLHKPSKTLVVTDLAFNFRPGGGEWTDGFWTGQCAVKGGGRLAVLMQTVEESSRGGWVHMDRVGSRRGEEWG